MTTIAALIEKYLDKILSTAFPYKIVYQWEQGVKTRSGKVVGGVLTSTNGLFGSGVHFYWPIIGTLAAWETNVEVFSTKPQSINEWTVSFLVQARIKRLDWWFINVGDPMPDVVADTVAAAASELVVKLPRGGGLPDDFCQKVRKVAQTRMHGWGCEIMRVSLETATKAPTLRLIGAVKNSVMNFGE